MNIARGVGHVFSRINHLRERLFSSKYLLYTNVGISISLSGVGDVLEQHYEILKVCRSYSYSILLLLLIYILIAFIRVNGIDGVSLEQEIWQYLACLLV